MIVLFGSGRSWLALELKMNRRIGVIFVEVQLSQTVPSFLLLIAFTAANTKVDTKWVQKFV